MPASFQAIARFKAPLSHPAGFKSRGLLAYKRSMARVLTRLTPNAQRILIHFARTNAPATPAELAAALNVDVETIYRNMQLLKRRGLVRSTEPPRYQSGRTALVWEMVPYTPPEPSDK